MNQLLANMDGFDSSKGLVVLGATNRPEVLGRPCFVLDVLIDELLLISRIGAGGHSKVHSKCFNARFR